MKRTFPLFFLLMAFLAPQGGNAVTIQVDSIKHVACNGQPTGAIYISVVTDTFYSVTWINVLPSQIDGINVINLYAGTYEVRAHAFDGTQHILFITIEEPPLLYINRLELYPPDCRGNSGFISVQAVGGVPGYQYDWGNGNHGSSQIVPFPGANYLLVVTDANGCEAIDALGAFPDYPFFRLDSTFLRKINCYNRQLWIVEDDPSLRSSEDFDPLSYHWTASAGGNILSNPDSSAILVDAAGRYTIVVTDEANGCTGSSLAIITVDTLPPSADAGPDKFLNCSTSIDTLIGLIQGPPDVGLYGYWEGPHILESISSTKVIIEGSGVYTLIAVNQENGCVGTDTAQVFSQHTTPSISTVGGIIGCLSDTTTITAVFDTLNTRFDGWFVSDTLFSMEQTLKLTEPITFLLEVTDTLTGCTGSSNAFVYVDTFPPTLEFYNDFLFCDSPLVQIRIDEQFNFPGDSIYYAFAWSGPQGFTSDAAQPWVKAAGTYTLLLTYLSTGCTNTLMVEVVSDDAEPPILLLQNATLHLNENGIAVLESAMVDAGSSDECGSIVEWTLEPAMFDCTALGENTVSITAYDQNGNSSTGTVLVFVLDTLSPTLSCPENLVRGFCDAQVFFVEPVGEDNCQTTIAQLNGLPSGAQFPVGTTEQRFVAVDGDGNSATCVFSVNVLPPLADVNISLTMPGCFNSCDGLIVSETIGGTPPFQYLWNTADTTSFLTNVCAGDYTLTVSDSMGCTSIWNTTLTEPDILWLELDSILHDYDNQGIGAIAVTAIGGTPPYSFSWAYYDVFYSNSEDLDSLFEGLYSCQLTDANNCLFWLMDIEIDNLVSTHEASLWNDLRLFPNPSIGWTQIQLPAGLSDQTLIQVSDGTGQLINSQIIPIGTQNCSLDLTRFPAGLYQVQVISSGQRARIPLVKVR